MKLSLFLGLACMSGILLWSHGCAATPYAFNISAEGSGDMEPEILVPTPSSTLVPATVSPTVRVTTAVRIKNFILNDVVDFLRDNLLLIIVVSSLLIVIVFIVCCASVMSHKRKLNAYYPSSFPAKKYVDRKDKSGGRRTFDEVPAKAHDSQKGEPVDSAKQFQTDIATVNKNLRTPSKALVGERGKEPKSIQPETQESQREKPKEAEPAPEPEKDEPKSKEPQQSPSPSPTQPLVCLCHLRNANPPKPDADK